MKFSTLNYFEETEEKKEIFRKKSGKVFLMPISYTNIKLLKNFITKFGKIKSRDKTFLKAKLQRRIAKAIKRSRNQNLIPINISLVF